MAKLSFPERVHLELQLEKQGALDEARLPASERPAQFVTVSELASLLRVSRRTIYRLIAAGDLPAYRLHNMIRVRWTDVQRALDRA
jgi:excisionase family DNA binding protein